MPRITKPVSSLIILLLLFVVVNSGHAQVILGDKIIGEWFNEENNDKIEIVKKGEFYEGRLLSGKNLIDDLNDSFKLDKNNPDPALKIRSLYYLLILSGFQYNDSVWNNGDFYDYKSGKHYDCIIRFKNNILEIRSYIGIKLFGRSTYWHKKN